MTLRRGWLVAYVVLAATGCAAEAGTTPPMRTAAPTPAVTEMATPAPRPTPSPPAPEPAAYGPLVLEPGGADGRTGSVEGPDGVRTFTLHLPDDPARRR